MHRLAESLRTVFALVLGVALAVVAMPTLVALSFSALILFLAVKRIGRYRYHGDILSQPTRKGAAGQSQRIPPIIETTYSVVYPSQN
ncbi:hypothetical protein BPNPMPFG_002280 [Mesorhizobium sp. AR07]|uniref:hypothetical protein n=1 Tax=Mesorhizobium sp. AR07 TaxID=2865838 RepID=UPI00215F9AEA|nr:hypothetical protein [Mesorhizobium sp. AR07]UVK46595.1 hypothetical protein BPNPMPFG_002280 [Mesorhizobium sp. AR07]